MYQVEASKVINAPLEETYEKTASPHTGPIFIPNLNENSKIVPDQTQVGQRFEWRYNFFGVDLRGTGEVIAMEPNKSWTLETKGDAQSRWYYTFQPDGGGTRVTLRVEYEVPDTAFARVSRPVSEKMNQRSCEQALDNLKAWLEP